VKQILGFCSFIFLVTACGGSVTPTTASDNTSSTASTGLVSSIPGGNEPAARFVFHKDNFTDLSDYIANPQTNFKCLGDIVKTYYATGADYSGTPSAFPNDTRTTDAFLPTTKPAFVKNVSVDITNTYFPLTASQSLLTDACSYRDAGGAATTSPCADFDEAPPAAPAPTIAPTPTASPWATPTATPTSIQYYGTKFYRVRDDFCAGQGPILNSNIDTTRTYVGGVNIDLDRSAIGSAEDLLMQVTYQAYNSNSSWPGVQGVGDETILEVDLIGTTLGLDLLLGNKQPRAWQDYGATAMPTYLKRIAVLRDPVGSLRTEQIYIPLSENGLIDRIRLERVRGSYHLYQIDLYRLGNRAN
jgi:hypothetical protein